MKSSSINLQLRKPIWYHSLVTLMQLGQPKNVVKVTQVFLQCSTFYCNWVSCSTLKFLTLNYTHCYNKGSTATSFLLLHWQAIERGDKDVVEKWLKRETPNLNRLRAEPPWSYESGTALHWAAYYGQFDIAKLLIDSGASMYLNVSLLLLLLLLLFLSTFLFLFVKQKRKTKQLVANGSC